MIYETLSHSSFRPGQVWSCENSNQLEITIIAIDSYPEGSVFNVVVEDGIDMNGVRRILAPIDSNYIEHLLSEKIRDHSEVTDDLISYDEWKGLAQQGKAGVWTTSPEQILSSVREQVR